MTARRQTKSSVIDKMPLVDTQEEEQSVRSNGHAKKDTDDRSFLTRTREGSVHYFDGNNIPLPDDVTVSGIYLKRLGKYIPMLTGIIEVIPTSNSGTSVRQNSITIQVSSPALPGDGNTSLTITRKPKEKEDYSKLDGFVITPSSTNEYDIAWKALKVLSIKARASCPESFPEYVDTLGWMNNMCVSVNGAIDSRGVITDKKVVVAAPSDWPQRIPDNHASLPDIIHANTLELLYDFWPREKTLFATALLGACSFIMNPAHDGTARWNLEIAGQTDWYKTTGINHFFHLFMGNGYKHDTPTQLVGGGNKKSDEDSGAGRRGSLNKLRYHAYMDYDHSVHPGQDGYEYQQKERIGKLKSFGNSDRAPAKADIHGNPVDRLNQSGMMIRTLESDPTIYTIAHGNESDEARAMTFILEGRSSAYKPEMRSKSEAIEERYSELDRMNILYKQWIASHGRNDVFALWHRDKEHAIKTIAAIEDAGNYLYRHSRVGEQLEDDICGLKTYARFLREVDLHQGTYAKVVDGGYDLAARIEADIEPIIHDRLSYSHNLAIKFYQARGGDTPKDAQAKVFFDYMRKSIADSEYHIYPVPKGFKVSKGSLGNKLKSTRLGFVPERSRFVACIREQVEAMVREIKDSRVNITTMTRFLQDMKEAGAIIGTNDKHKYDKWVRDPLTSDKKSDWYICFPLDRVWPDVFSN